MIEMKVEESLKNSMKVSMWIIIISGALIALIMVICYKLIWVPYLEEINKNIWRTKELLNLIPMRIVKDNDMLKNEFISGKFEAAIK